jgi:FixJ family two-component response regulator
VRVVSQDRPTVALVDDEEAVRRALKRLMVSSGITVEAFASGAEFLDSLATRRPDCLVLDLNMPGLSGFDVQARLAQSTTPRRWW